VAYGAVPEVSGSVPNEASPRTPSGASGYTDHDLQGLDELGPRVGFLSPVERMQARLVIQDEDDSFNGQLGSECGPGGEMSQSIVDETLARIARRRFHLDEHVALPRGGKEVRADRVVEELLPTPTRALCPVGAADEGPGNPYGKRTTPRGDPRLEVIAVHRQPPLGPKVPTR
jgi:hypothetical protein